MACSAAPLALADARAKYEGSRVLKRFGEELYGGVCDEVWADDNDGGALVFHVTYDDGDAEDVDADEFAELCERAAERAKKNAPMDADEFAELCEDAAEHARKSDAAEPAQKSDAAEHAQKDAGNGTPEFAAKPEDTPPAPGGKQRVAVPRSPAPAAAQRLLVDLSNSSPRKADASDAGPAAAGDLDGADGDGVQEAIDGTAGDTETPPKRPRRQAAARGLSQAALREAQAAQIEEMLEDEKSHKRRRLAAVGNGVGGQRSGSGDDDDSDSSSDEDDIVILDDSDAPEAEEQEYSYTQDAYLNPGKSRHVPFPPWSTSAAASMPRPRMPLLAHERRAAHARGELPQQAQGSHWDGATKDVRVWLPVHKDVALRHERSCVCCMCLAGTSHGRKNASTRSSSSEAELDELWRDIQRAEREDGAVFVGRKEAEKSGWSEGSGTHWTEHYRMVTRMRFGLEFDSDKDGPHPSVLKLWQNVPTEPKELMGHAVLPPWYIGFKEDSAPEQKARRAARAAVARYRELEDDARGMEADRAASHSKKKNALRATAKRPDLKAFNMMREEERCLDNEARVKCAGGGERQFTKVGTLPGVPVGTTCSSRAEAFALGLHCHWLGGMVGGKCKLAQRRQKGQPQVEYLVSITSSGGYEGDEDGGDVMTYTGSGGNDMLHDAKQVSDQTFTNKNAQLASSAELGLPIRVIRKQAAGSGSGQHGLGPTGRKDEYVYDGLYVCTRYVLQYGISGYVECKYRLERLPGQPPIQSGSVHFNAMGGGSSPLPPWMTPDRRAGFTGVWDITLGQGSVHPIPVINEYRHAAMPVPVPIFLTAGATHPTNEHQNGFKPWDEGAAVPDNAIGESAFYYAAEPVLAECAKGAVHETPPENLALVQNEKSLQKLNNSKFLPYDARGNLQCNVATVVYEGPRNGPQSCLGKDKPIHLRLEVYRTDTRGWGVRCWDVIRPGTFVAPFTGQVFLCDTADERNKAVGADVVGSEAYYQAMEYQFDLEVKAVDVHLDIAQTRDMSREESGPTGEAIFKQSGLTRDQVNDDGFVLDGKYHGSVARFINHSDTPNLQIQNVLLPDNHDCRLCRLALFALEQIPPMTELTYFYSEDYMKTLTERGKYTSVKKVGSR